MWQGWLAGIRPRREPVRADIGSGIRELANQRARRLIVEAIEVFIVVRLAFQPRIAIRELDHLQPAMRTQASLESMVGGIVDERTIIRTHGEKGRKAVDESCSKSLVDPFLVREVAIEIFRGVEGIVGLGDIKRENR